jgi:rhodanese-related sulfurtransferase
MGIRTISVDVLAGWLQSAEPPRLIDVLSRAHFDRAHPPGAESIPRAELHQRALREIPLDEPAVVSSADRLCRESFYAAVILAELGNRQVYDFEGGLAEWRRQSLPLTAPSHAAKGDLSRRPLDAPGGPRARRARRPIRRSSVWPSGPRRGTPFQGRVTGCHRRWAPATKSRTPGSSRAK